MDKSTILFLPTIPSNGNYFIQELLRAYTNDGGHCKIMLRHLYSFKDADFDKFKGSAEYVLVHTHFKYDDTKTMSWFEPVERVERWLANDDYVPLTPIRDPVRALLTAQVSGYISGNINYIVDLYCIMADWYSKYPIYVLPVDLLSELNSSDRNTAVHDFMDSAGIRKGSGNDEFIQDWPVFNHRINRCRSEYRYETPCEEDDIRLLYPNNMEELPSALPAYSYLLEKINELRPFLERVGYRNLPWW